MSAQYIYTMHKLTRFYPPDREVLKDINLSFYPGAKIGVLGANGAGKSSLLKIMAGKDDGFTGEARLTQGFTVGMLEQEPHLDETKTVKENVLDGVAEVTIDRDGTMAGPLLSSLDSKTFDPAGGTLRYQGPEHGRQAAMLGFAAILSPTFGIAAP